MSQLHFKTLCRRAGLTSLIALWSCLPAAGRELVTVTMTAPSELEAIRYALTEAVGRVNGVDLSTGGKLHPELAQVMRRIEVDFDPQSKDPFHIRAVSEGYVRRYEVRERSVSDAGVTVEIQANVLSFDPSNPRPGARQTVVIEGFTLAPGALQLDQPAVGAEVLLAGLRADLESSLVRSRKFSVLTRKNLAGLLKEQDFIAGGRVERAEKLKLQRMLGGDYVVAGSIDRIYVHTETSTVKLTGYQARTKTAEVSMTVTLYNVGTGVVAWTAPYTQSYSWGTAELKADPSFDDDGIVARTMVIEAADSLSKQLVRQVFPLRVIEADMQAPAGPVFFLNAGSGLYSIGDRFELIQLGRELRDPDTGELLGHRERIVALVRIVRQNDKLSQAEWADPEVVDRAYFSGKDFDPTLLACRPLR